jgi:hypothetical protein
MEVSATVVWEIRVLLGGETTDLSGPLRTRSRSASTPAMAAHAAPRSTRTGRAGFRSTG